MDKTWINNTTYNHDFSFYNSVGELAEDDLSRSVAAGGHGDARAAGTTAPAASFGRTLKNEKSINQSIPEEGRALTYHFRIDKCLSLKWRRTRARILLADYYTTYLFIQPVFPDHKQLIQISIFHITNYFSIQNPFSYIYILNPLIFIICHHTFSIVLIIIICICYFYHILQWLLGIFFVNWLWFIICIDIYIII